MLPSAPLPTTNFPYQHPVYDPYYPDVEELDPEFDDADYDEDYAEIDIEQDDEDDFV